VAIEDEQPSSSAEIQELTIVEGQAINMHNELNVT
jgi:hypothetical protein